MDGGDIDQLAAAIESGDRRALARGITLVESTRSDHRAEALQLLERLAPKSGGAMRVAISGTPGVGKSTFIESLGMHILATGSKVAVLAIDPSSTLSGGSILGDKTRMEVLSRESGAFIRPSPSGGTLGGVAGRTREAMLLCEASGFDVVLVETVGVGQSETMASQMTDMFVLLLSPGGGDELQGIKRGIMELADMVLINKADGDLEHAATRAVSEYRMAMQLLRARSEHWSVPVESVSALTGRGIEACWEKVAAFHRTLSEHGEIDQRRAAQATSWMWAEINESLVTQFRGDPAVNEQLGAIESAVRTGQLPPTSAAVKLLSFFGKTNEGS